MLREEITRCDGNIQKQQSENSSSSPPQQQQDDHPYFDCHFYYKNNAAKAISHCFKPRRFPFSWISPLFLPSTSSSCQLYKMDRQYYLPCFLFTSTSKKTTVSQLEHFLFMWINATLKPKLLPMFWIWLSQPQRLMIRSRFHQRMRKYPTTRRRKKIKNDHIMMRRNDRFHWYGIYPIPPTKRTRTLWLKNKKKLTRPPPTTTTTVVLRSQEPITTTKGKLRKHWMPPINSETVQELSIVNIFKSIQLRHDLLFDPHLSFRPNLDGRSGREKCKKSSRYWRRVYHVIQSLSSNNHLVDDHDALAFLRILLTELQKIIISLYSPFASTPASHEPWSWPPHISLDHFLTVFDVDFIIHQIHHGLFCLDAVIHLIIEIVTPLCPSSDVNLLSSLQSSFLDRHFGIALRQCFSLLEAIKLDCANRILQQYRSYLLDTCSKIEFHCFKRQLDSGQIKLDSTYDWLQHHWKKQHQETNFNFYNVYHQGLIQLISTNQLDNSTTSTLRFPITLQFDERRLTQQLRQEFQSLILISIVLIPYRYIAGPFATCSDMARLKRMCIDLCKDCCMMGTKDIFTLFDGADDDDNSILDIGYRLAYKSCYRAFQAHYRHHVLENQKIYGDDVQQRMMAAAEQPPPLANTEQLTQVSQFWANWLFALLKTRNSRLYRLIHDRLTTILCFISQHGTCHLANNGTMMANLDLMVGIQDTIMMLGEKLKILADLNLETFGSIYKVLALDFLHNNNDNGNNRQ